MKLNMSVKAMRNRFVADAGLVFELGDGDEVWQISVLDPQTGRRLYAIDSLVTAEERDEPDLLVEMVIKPAIEQLSYMRDDPSDRNEEPREMFNAGQIAWRELNQKRIE